MTFTSFSLLSLLATHLPSISMAASYANIDCQTVSSNTLGNFNNGERRVSCPAGYTMTGCGYWAPWTTTQQSYIDTITGECVAVTNTDAGGKGINAIAQCCDISAFVECATVENSATAGNGATATAECQDAFPNLDPAFIDVVGCVSMGEVCADETSCDTAVTNGNGVITNQICTGHEQANTGTTVDVQSVCCQQMVDDAQMECQQIIGDPTSTANDAQSTISCKETLGDEWFLTSCGSSVGTTTSANRPKLDGHYAIGSSTPANDVCRVSNSGWNGKTYPVAQCCRIATTFDPTKEPTKSPSKGPTESPTKSPSKNPTTSPTLDGCDFDLATYLDQCYCDGLQPGLNLGSAHSGYYNDGMNDVFNGYEFNEFQERFYEFMAEYKVNNEYNYNTMMLLMFTNGLTMLGLMVCGCMQCKKGQRGHRYGKVDFHSTTDDEQQPLH